MIRQQILKPLLLVVSVLLSSLMISTAFADPVWIDVRTQEEYNDDHIPGDMHMPMNVINPESMAELYGKNSELRFYCRSGGRAGQVVTMLEEAGFTNVHNAGGIDDARDARDMEDE